MTEYTKDEALAFIESMRVLFSSRVGFKWLGEKLALLAAYVEAITAENEALKAAARQEDAGTSCDEER